MQPVNLNQALVAQGSGLHPVTDSNETGTDKGSTASSQVISDKLSKLKAKLSTNVSSGTARDKEIKSLSEGIKLGDDSNPGRYEVKRSLHRGGMGTVWIALDNATSQEVALKVLHPGKHGEKIIHRFIREAAILFSISHPNIVPVLDVDESGEYGPYLIMKLIEGETFDLLIKNLYRSNETNNQKFLTLNQELQILKFIAQVAEGLHVAHSHRVTHRDIKPSNIMVSNNTPVIIDFGLARLEGASELTSLHNIVGTAAYIAPEQASGGNVDGRADLYSLGVILYESLTGQLPFKGEALKLIKDHGDITPKPPIKINPAIDIELNALIIRLLRKDPDERYQSTKELANEITRIINRIEGGPPRQNRSLRNLLSSF